MATRVFYIYKTTCIITGKYYIGMHTTTRPTIKYYGSGTIIKRSLNKYGKHNHVVEILEYVNDINILRESECRWVSELVLTDPLCMNMMVGGRGGFTEEQRVASRKAFANRIQNDPEFKQYVSESNSRRARQVTLEGRKNCSKALKRRYTDPEFKASQLLGARKANKDSHKARKQKVAMGWIWMKDPMNNKRRKLIAPDKIDTLKQQGWRVGRC